MRRHRKHHVGGCLVLAAALLFGSGLRVESAEHPELRSGELEALRTALAAEIDLMDFQRVEIGDSLELRWDSRRQRRRALEALRRTAPEVTDEMQATFEVRNRKKLELWPGARKTLGERADKRVFLIADPKGLHVQFARIGWNATAELGLVYFELRPRDGSEPMRAIFRIVRRAETGWLVERGRAAVDRGSYERQVEEPGDEPRF